MPLFEIAIIQKPTRKELDEGTGAEQLIFGPRAIAAPNAQAAGIMAVRGNDLPPGFDMARSEVLVRPFA